MNYNTNELLKVNINQITPFHDNCKIHNRKNIESIKKSIQLFGQYKPLIVSLRTKQILVGNGTYQALKQLNTHEVYVIFLDLTEEQQKTLNISDNKLSTLSHWNKNLVDKIYNFDEDLLNTLDFDQNFLDKLITKNTQSTIDKKQGYKISEQLNKIVEVEPQYIECPCCKRKFRK